MSLSMERRTQSAGPKFPAWGNGKNSRNKLKSKNQSSSSSSVSSRKTSAGSSVSRPSAPTPTRAYYRLRQDLLHPDGGEVHTPDGVAVTEEALESDTADIITQI